MAAAFSACRADFVVVHGLRQTLVGEADFSFAPASELRADDGCGSRSRGDGDVASDRRCSFQRRARAIAEAWLPQVPPLPLLRLLSARSQPRSRWSARLLRAGALRTASTSAADFASRTALGDFDDRKQFFQQRREFQFGEKLRRVAMSGSPTFMASRSSSTGTLLSMVAMRLLKSTISRLFSSDSR